MSPLSTVILAAGKGTRMYSAQPKVLHQIGGKSMLQHVLDTVYQLPVKNNYVIYGYGKTQLAEALQGQAVHLVLQAHQLGTGHAVMQVLPHLQDEDDVLILYADTPLIKPQTLQQLLALKTPNTLSLLTMTLADPTGYGRIVRQQGKVCSIVEQKDATPDQLNIKEINTGIMVVTAKWLKKWLGQINNHNAQQEYYLTDIISLAYHDQIEIVTCQPGDPFEVEGVNNRLQLAHLERTYQMEQAKQLLLAGVTLRDPQRFDLRGVLTHGQDVIIEANVIIEGEVTLGDRVTIGTGCVLKNCAIGEDSEISPYSVIEKSTLAKGCTIGPFARLRPGVQLDDRVHVGNFVELKNAHLAQDTKAGHLSYLGDSQIGQNVNIGAGTITCNYDGANKHKTIIGDDVFVGSDTQLIAPVTVGHGATIGAGTTVTQNVADNELVLSRVKQRHITGWVRPQKQKK